MNVFTYVQYVIKKFYIIPTLSYVKAVIEMFIEIVLNFLMQDFNSSKPIHPGISDSAMKVYLLSIILRVTQNLFGH